MHRDIGLLDAILVNAVDIASETEREAYLDQVCGEDAALRREIASLVADHFRAGSFLEEAAMLALTIDEPGPRIGEQIGRYKLLERIGEGGMGIVYVAEQTAPVRRKVALKVIKPGMDSRQVIARFEAERQALALMEHPHIARILDAGMTDGRGEGAGLPYFVMELVRGLPITEYCDEARLHPRQRLELFITVCQAVQHAHQKGIIHRDLKPSNILVTLHDGEPVAKVIDFGVAKAIGQQLTEHTIYTAFAQMIGTPLYMSPEQAELSALDIDTRSDVYSLGVLLYELLTGQTPFDRATFLKAGHDEMRRMIREDEPPRPSQRLGTLNAEAVSTLSAERGLDHRQLSNLVRGELDWIAMKCLEKDRKRRYESASHLANDIEHYLNDESVEACPPRLSYRLRKSLKRHRKSLVTAGMVVLLLVVAVVITSWQALEAMRGKTEADRARQAVQAALLQSEVARSEAEAAHAQAAESLRQAQLARSETEAVNRFLVDDLLSQAVPENNSHMNEVTLIEVVNRASDRIHDRFSGQPFVEATLRLSLGGIYHSLGNYSKSEEHYRRAVSLRRQHTALDDVGALKAMAGLGHALFHLDQHEEGLQLLQTAYTGLSSRLGNSSEVTLKCASHLATALNVDGRRDLALRLREDILRHYQSTFGSEHRDTLSAMRDLATAYLAAGKADLAEPLIQQTRELQKSTLPEDGVDGFKRTYNLAMAYYHSGRTRQAIPLLEKTLQLQTVRYGVDHPSTLTTMSRLGVSYHRRNDSDLGIRLLEQALELNRAKHGSEDPATLAAMRLLASAYLACKRDGAAISLIEERFHATEKIYGLHHVATASARFELATVYTSLSRSDKAINLYSPLFEKEGMGRNIDQVPVKHRAVVLGGYARVLMQADRFCEAEEIARECLTIREEHMPNNWNTFYAKSILGAALTGQQRYDEAEQLLLDAYDGLKGAYEEDDSIKNFFTETLERLASLYDSWDKPYEATWWRTVLEEQIAVNKAATATPASATSAAPSEGEADSRH